MRIIERRKHKPLTQPDFEIFDIHLNVDQMKTYTRMHEIGWKMYFIRRPLFRKLTVVMKNNAGTRVAVIEQDGRSTVNPMKISWRRKFNSSSRLISSPC